MRHDRICREAGRRACRSRLASRPCRARLHRKEPGMLPKLKCAADAPDFLQRMMDRTRERIRARHRQSAGIVDGETNHRDGGNGRPKRQPQSADSPASESAAAVADDVASDDVPF